MGEERLKPLTVVNEKLIQNDLYCYLHNSMTIFPNMDCITRYEADILAITRSGYVYEYEIKISLADFRADLKKTAKHKSLSGNVRKIPYPYEWGREKEIYVQDDAPDDPYKALGFQCYPDLRPKEFWYVVHGFNVPESEIPVYAGLMRYTKNSYPRFEILKKAPRLLAQKITQEKINHALSNMLFRYWRLRMNKQED